MERRIRIRPYDRSRDADGLWQCKREFEIGLGTGTGEAEKADAYRSKLTPAYRERWLEWVDRCCDSDPRCVTVAVDDGNAIDDDDGGVCGYAFCLPERLAFVWDAAVLNEIYVEPAHRGTEVADELLAAALDLARDQELPLDRIVLDVDPDNDRAVAFYKGHGFTKWGEMVARTL